MEYKHIHKEEIAKHDDGNMHKIISDQHGCQQTFGISKQTTDFFIGRMIAFFCDSEFWHGYDWENKKNNIKSRRDFWWPKIEKNMQRDKKVTEQLTAEGWLVIRFWGDEIKNQPIRCADIVEEAIRKR